MTWNYSVATAEVEFLAAGQTKDETFDFNVLDGHGGSVPRTVTVTITGTNDAPVLNAAATPVLCLSCRRCRCASRCRRNARIRARRSEPAGRRTRQRDRCRHRRRHWHRDDRHEQTQRHLVVFDQWRGRWTQVGAVSNASALLLAADANTRVYFQGDSNFNGTVSDGITFRAWDQTSGTAGTKVSTASTAALPRSRALPTPQASRSTRSTMRRSRRATAVTSRTARQSRLPTSVLACERHGHRWPRAHDHERQRCRRHTGLTLNANGTFTFTTAHGGCARLGSFTYTLS